MWIRPIIIETKQVHSFPMFGILYLMVLWRPLICLWKSECNESTLNIKKYVWDKSIWVGLQVKSMDWKHWWFCFLIFLSPTLKS
uniref:Uncharacterized protein n=1 Tax=Anguilla anguilla TaxID=7936 RepID=A0A0E9S7F2_ANGAN